VYRKHYDEVQQILALPDISQREQRLESYMKAVHPESKILQYMEAFFGQILQEYQKGGMTAQADALTKKMQQWFPESDAMLPQQFKSAFDSKNYTQAIPLGEKLLQKHPDDAQLLVMVAQAYQQTNNTAKLANIAPKVVQAVGPKNGVYYVVWLANHHRSQGNVSGAMQYYDLLVQTYPSGKPEGWTDQQWNPIMSTAYSLRGNQAFKSEEWGAAAQAFTLSTQYEPKNDAAYLALGLSFWRLQQLDAAQAAFAKAVVLEKSTSEKARQYLEQIYGPLNGDSLEGMDKLLDKAREELKL
jgi:tetratricopeptide (TPR) repeat protein